MSLARIPSDGTGCPECAAENKAAGGGVDYGDASFNYGGHAWSVCWSHGVRWYVTRELCGLSEGGEGFARLLEVEPVLHLVARP